MSSGWRHSRMLALVAECEVCGDHVSEPAPGCHEIRIEDPAIAAVKWRMGVVQAIVSVELAAVKVRVVLEGGYDDNETSEDLAHRVASNRRELIEWVVDCAQRGVRRRRSP